MWYQLLSVLGIASLAFSARGDQRGIFERHDSGAGFQLLNTTIPLPCAGGCTPPLRSYSRCNVLQQEAPCLWLCSPTNYTQFTQCCNCMIAEGGTVPSVADLQASLDRVNLVCLDVQGFTSSVTVLTASPTTTAPTLTSLPATGGLVTLPVWTGLTSLGDFSVYSFPSVNGGVIPIGTSGLSTSKSGVNSPSGSSSPQGSSASSISTAPSSSGPVISSAAASSATGASSRTVSYTISVGMGAAFFSLWILFL